MKANALRFSIRFGGHLEIHPIYLEERNPIADDRMITVPATPKGSRGWLVHINHRHQLAEWFREHARLDVDDEPTGPAP